MPLAFDGIHDIIWLQSRSPSFFAITEALYQGPFLQTNMTPKSSTLVFHLVLAMDLSIAHSHGYVMSVDCRLYSNDIKLGVQWFEAQELVTFLLPIWPLNGAPGYCMDSNGLLGSLSRVYL